MFSKHTRRLGRSLLALVLVLQTACAGGRSVLDREQLEDPEPARFYLVTLKDGRELTFISLHLEGEWLMGTERITSSQTLETGEEERINVTNRYEERRLPWADVSRVEAERKKGADRGYLLAAGALVAGVAAFFIFSGGSDTPSSNGGGGGKEF